MNAFALTIYIVVAVAGLGLALNARALILGRRRLCGECRARRALGVACAITSLALIFNAIILAQG